MRPEPIRIGTDGRGTGCGEERATRRRCKSRDELIAPHLTCSGERAFQLHRQGSPITFGRPVGSLPRWMCEIHPDGFVKHSGTSRLGGKPDCAPLVFGLFGFARAGGEGQSCGFAFRRPRSCDCDGTRWSPVACWRKWGSQGCWRRHVSVQARRL